MGANENTFLVRGTHFDVLRNVVGGVEDKGVSFAITPPPSSKNRPGGGAGFTPSRVLLTGEWTQRSALSLLNIWCAQLSWVACCGWSFGSCCCWRRRCCWHGAPCCLLLATWPSAFVFSIAAVVLATL